MNVYDDGRASIEIDAGKCSVCETEIRVVQIYVEHDLGYEKLISFCSKCLNHLAGQLTSTLTTEDETNKVIDPTKQRIVKTYDEDGSVSEAAFPAYADESEINAAFDVSNNAANDAKVLSEAIISASEARQEFGETILGFPVRHVKKTIYAGTPISVLMTYGKDDPIVKTLSELGRVTETDEGYTVELGEEIAQKFVDDLNERKRGVR